MDESLVSVIIPTYNTKPEWLRLAIDSVLQQSYSNVEVIVVDDCSDIPFSGLHGKINDWRIRWLKNDENRGVSAARNVGAMEAQGEWLAFLDADDWWAPEKLKLQIDQLGRDGTRWSYTSAYIMTPDEAIISTSIAEYYGDVFRDVLSRMVVTGSASGVMVEKTLFLELGGFDEAGNVVEDWDMWIRLAHVSEVSCVEKPLVFIRCSANSRGSNAGKISRVIALQQKHRHAIAENCLQAVAKAHLYSLKAKRLIVSKRYVAACWYGLLNIYYRRDIKQFSKAIVWLKYNARQTSK